MAQANLSGDTGKQTEILAQLRCVAGWTDKIHTQLILISAFNIFLSVTAFLGNTFILVALFKQSSLHPPSKLLYRCLATTDLCLGLITGPSHVAYLLSLVDQNLDFCRYALSMSFIAGFSLSSVSLLTMTAISVDRLLALLLELRYRQVVTMKRTCVIVIMFWVVSIVTGASYFFNHRIAIWYSYIVIPLCLATATFSYAKIFHTLYRSHYQVHIHTLQQLGQPLNMARYRKAVYSALWVQLALVCLLSSIQHSEIGASKGRTFSTAVFSLGIYRDLSLRKLVAQSYSLLLEDKWNKTSSEGDNHTSTLLSMELVFAWLKTRFAF